MESWTLSQSYFFGSVADNPDHRVELVEGQPIDVLDDLDEIWRGKPDTKLAAKDNGAGRTQGAVDEAALIEEIRSGASYHMAAIRLIGTWARAGIAMMAAEARLRAFFEDVFPPDRDERWRDRVADIPRLLEYVYGKQGEATAITWSEPDLGVLQLQRRTPPALPIDA